MKLKEETRKKEGHEDISNFTPRAPCVLTTGNIGARSGMIKVIKSQSQEILIS